MKTELEKTVAEFFKICHKEPTPEEFQAEVSARLANQKAKAANAKPRQPKRVKGDFLAGYRLKRRSRIVGGNVVQTED